MFAFHFLKTMAASFFADKNSKRKQISRNGTCRSRQVKNKPFAKTRIGSTRKKRGTVDILTKKSRNKKKTQKHFKSRENVKNELYSTLSVSGPFEPTNLLKEMTTNFDKGITSNKVPFVAVKKCSETDYSKVCFQKNAFMVFIFKIF